jgi:glycosyltransferase involved in cell wall biosynthesis/predicted HAD superfamily hydrolase
LKLLGLPSELPRDIRLLSLDVFDTALRRAYSQPTHVFCRTQRDLAGCGYNVNDFAEIRIRAERLARHTAWQAHKRPDTTLASIYNHLQSLTGLAWPVIEKAKELEIAAELACVKADSVVAGLFGKARDAGIPVVFVSDMYLPREVIERMLTEHGYAGYLELFLSSDRFLAKHDGSLFATVLETFELAPDRVLHIGDNSHADAAVPRKMGLRQHRYEHRREAMAKLRPTSPDVLPLSRLKARHWPPGQSTADVRGFFEYLGRTYGQLIHGSYVQWIAQSVIENQSDLVLFFSRDGYLLKKIYDMFRGRSAPLPPSAYCCVSRFTLGLSRITGLDEDAYTFLLSGVEPRTAGHILRRFGLKLDPASEAAVLAEHGLAPDDVVIHDWTARERMRQVMRHFETPLLLEASRQRAALHAYLSRFALNRIKRLAIVDLGWAGNMQTGFDAVIRGLGFTGDLLGHFMGIVVDPHSLRRAGHNIFAFLENYLHQLADPAGPDANGTSLLGIVTLMELLHAAPHGGVCGYESRLGTMRPCFADNPLEKRQYDGKLSFYQEAVLREMAGRGFDDGAFSRAACREAITDLCLYPSHEEAAILGDLVHFDGVEHVGDGMAIAPALALDADAEATRTAFEKAYWRSGFLERNQAQCQMAGLPGHEGLFSNDGGGQTAQAARTSLEASSGAPPSHNHVQRETGHQPTLLFLTHDMSRTGAPIVLLHWLRWLKLHSDYSIRVIHLWGGVLREDFQEIAPLCSFYDDIAPAGLRRQDQLQRLKDFCGGDVHAVYGNTAFCCEMYDLISSLKAPIITHLHELEYVLREFVGKARLDLMRKYTSCYIAASPLAKDNLVAKYGVDPGYIDVIHAFIAPTVTSGQIEQKSAIRRQLGIPVDAIVIIGCGTIEWRKGTDLFIEVAKHVREMTDKQVSFYWLGGRWTRHADAEHTVTVDDNIPEHSVFFPGVQKNPKDYMIASDVFLLTSREECFPLAALEACECGLPVVCFREVGDMAEFITPDIGVVVEREDAKAMAEALAGLISNPSGMEALGQAARKKVLASHVVDNSAPLLLDSVRRAVAAGQAGTGQAAPLPGPGQDRSGVGPLSILVLSHNLTCSGAPLLLLHFLRWLRLHTDCSLHIIYLQGGPLREDFAKIAPLCSFYEDIAPSGVAFEEQARRLAAFCAGHVHLVLGNTAFCAEVYGLMATLRAPIVSYVHELEYVMSCIGQDRLSLMREHSAHYIAGSVRVRDQLVAGQGLDPGNIDVVDAFFAPTVKADRLEAKAALRRELGLPEEAVIILSCGFIEWRKGPDLFIEVAGRVRQMTDKPLLFCWMGRELPEAPCPKRLLAGIAPENPILFLGEKTNHKDYFLACDVFLLTMREGYSSLASLEAYECGLPVICFQGVGVLAEFVTPDIGAVVDFEDTQAMAEALADILKDEDRRKAMGLAGRKKALSTYVVDNAAPLLLSSLRRVVTAGQGLGLQSPAATSPEARRRQAGPAVRP